MTKSYTRRWGDPQKRFLLCAHTDLFNDGPINICRLWMWNNPDLLWNLNGLFRLTNLVIFSILTVFCLLFILLYCVKYPVLSYISQSWKKSQLLPFRLLSYTAVYLTISSTDLILIFSSHLTVNLWQSSVKYTIPEPFSNDFYGTIL